MMRFCCVIDQSRALVEPGSGTTVWLEGTGGTGQSQLYPAQDALSSQPFRRARCPAQEQGVWEGELTHTSRNGTTVIVESRQVLMRDQEGHPTAILEINRDVTERRREEQASQVAHATTIARLTIFPTTP